MSHSVGAISGGAIAIMYITDYGVLYTIKWSSLQLAVIIVLFLGLPLVNKFLGLFNILDVDVSYAVIY